MATANYSNLTIIHSTAYGSSGGTECKQPLKQHTWDMVSASYNNTSYHTWNVIRLSDIKKADEMVAKAISLYNNGNNNILYSQINRSSIYNNINNYSPGKTYYADCSSFISSLLKYVGYNVGCATTATLKSALSKITSDFTYFTPANMSKFEWKCGDIIVSENDHTFLVVKDAYGLTTAAKYTSTNREKLWAYFISEGATEAGAAGIIGNLMQESYDAVIPTVAQGYGSTDTSYCNALDNGTYSRTAFCSDGIGFGIAQWTESAVRKPYFWNYWKSYGDGKHSAGSLEMQAHCLWNEIVESYPKTYQSVTTTTSYIAAAKTFHDDYEKSADSSTSVRESKAAETYKEFAGSNMVLSWDGSTAADISSSVSSQKVIESTPVTWSSNFLALDVDNLFMKYNTSSALKSCIFYDNEAYTDKKSTANKKGITFFMSDEQNGYLSNYVWPSEKDTNYTTLCQELGNYSPKNWNYSGYKCPHAWIGKAASGAINSYYVLDGSFQGTMSNDTVNKNYLQVALCKGGKNNDELYREMLEVVAYYCCKYTINPLANNLMSTTNAPYIATIKEITGVDDTFTQWLKDIGKTIENVREDIVSLIMGKFSIPTYPELATQDYTEILDMNYSQFKILLNKWLTNRTNYKGSIYSAPARTWCQDKKIILGYSEDVENPDYQYQSFATRAEVVSMIDRFLKIMGGST